MELSEKYRRFGKGALLRLWQDEDVTTEQKNVALTELARRGIDAKTGEQVGAAQATKIAASITT